MASWVMFWRNDIQLDKSEEAELGHGLSAGQVLSARLVRGPDSGAVLDGAGRGRRASPLPAACPAWLPEVATLCGRVSRGLQMGF